MPVRRAAGLGMAAADERGHEGRHGQLLDMKKPARALLNRARAGQTDGWIFDDGKAHYQNSLFPIIILSNLQIGVCMTVRSKRQSVGMLADACE